MNCDELQGRSALLPYKKDRLIRFCDASVSLWFLRISTSKLKIPGCRHASPVPEEFLWLYLAHLEKRCAARARALAATSARFLVGAFVSSELSRLAVMAAIASTAA